MNWFDIEEYDNMEVKWFGFEKFQEIIMRYNGQHERLIVSSAALNTALSRYFNLELVYLIEIPICGGDISQKFIR